MENTTSNTSQGGDSKNQSEEIGAFWKRTSRNNMTFIFPRVYISNTEKREAPNESTQPQAQETEKEELL